MKRRSMPFHREYAVRVERMPRRSDAEAGRHDDIVNVA
jgi:hypothetical protein